MNKTNKANKANKFNPKKLLNAKWTAVNPQNKERHFIVVKLLEDPQIEGKIEACILQSVMHKNDYEIRCEQLKDAATWLQGWK
ncbi:TIGR02450 family Trp-rich protein [Thiomicrorhabdus sp. Milos-T2]|uniref:TIGR02450 family Trp-rich protein n=1 Tax=Thiomicrorhabdus sp. Milos-T2 TaxID=90814 RepID=UPI000493CE2F|nr:TIGR02450 family Trp-rich protein [Thiomicrorhabdus sp. Milos-T2]